MKNIQKFTEIDAPRITLEMFKKVCIKINELIDIIEEQENRIKKLEEIKLIDK